MGWRRGEGAIDEPCLGAAVVMEAKLSAALDLLKRLPPSRVYTYLQCLIELEPEIAEDLLSSVDQPLQVANDKTKAKQYLLCDYNRDGDSYRSPWSNTYDPPDGEAVLPSDELRKLEVKGNEVFQQYCGQYYDGGISSLYLWDQDDEGFAGALLFKKDCGKISKSSMEKGVWDAIHVLEVVPGSPAAAYKLSSTVMLSAVKKDVFRLEGSLTRQAEKKLKQADGHVPNVGTMVEEMEGDMRNSLHQVRPLRCPVYAFERACVRVRSRTDALRALLV